MVHDFGWTWSSCHDGGYDILIDQKRQWMLEFGISVYIVFANIAILDEESENTNMNSKCI